MTETVSFPNLGLSFNIGSDAFTIFGISIKWYAILITVGYLLAIIFAVKKSKKFGLDFDKVLDVIIFGTLGGIVGARLYFVAFKLDYYIANPSEIFAIREGGLAIYGGIIGAIITACIVAKVKKMKFIPILDIGAIGFLIGQGIGRWGNFVNREAYGAMTNPDFIFGMTSPSIAKDVAIEMGVPYSENILVHPCFLYESIWCLLGAVLLFFYIKHRKFDGEIGLLYCLWYGIERTIVEGLRTDSLYIGDTGIRVSQALSFILALTALIALIILYYKIYKNRIKLNNNNYLVLYANTEKSKQELEQSEKQRKDSRNKEKSKNETKKEDTKPL